MQIHYFGLSSFKITTKDATIITDPFDKESGLLPPRGAVDIIILSEKNNKLYNAISGFSGDPFLMNDPGDYDLKGVTVTAIPLKQEGDETKDGKPRYVSATLIEAEDMRILNLNHIRTFSMKEDDLDALGEIDILILPVGGNSVMTAKDASKIAHEIEPKIIIPSHYSTEGLALPYEKVDDFIKEMGGKSEKVEKLLLKKKDLIAEQMIINILEPLR
jgi:L-ascorbate metabolism protein UlaG (beta-lactamase superfamily)